MSFADEVRGMDASLFDDFGEDALLNDQQRVRVVVDQDVQRVSDFGDVIFNKYEVTTMIDQVPVLKKGDFFRLENGVYTVCESPINDGFIRVSVVSYEQ